MYLPAAENRAHRGPLDQLVLLDLKDQQDLREYKVFKEPKATLETKE
jgi:hypothetical protein